jgi:flagellum-specific peptidoglycan hydrolase FlgJ
MTPAEFKRTYYPAIERSCAQTGLNPLFVAAQAALESNWGKAAIGNNLFGITAGDKWTGKRRAVRTTEYFRDDRQGGRFTKVYAITPLADGRYRYDVERQFRDYDTVEECLADHFKVLSAKRYAGAMAYKQDVVKFAYEVARAGYCTASPGTYASSIGKIAQMIASV